MGHPTFVTGGGSRVIALATRAASRLLTRHAGAGGMTKGRAALTVVAATEGWTRRDHCALQNSILPWKAIMRGELSPPNPTPSNPVGGEIVLVKAPKPVCVAGLPGVPA